MLDVRFLDELRARTLLSGLIGQSVKLQRAGREWKACCPFHNEKTPSFTINDEKGFYHCFGCGAHGDAIRFLTDARGLPFIDAVKELADKAGLDVPAPDPHSQLRAERAKDLFDVMEAASKWYQEQLGEFEGADARSYLEQRGVAEATRRRFYLGYAPDSRNKLKIALREFGTDKLVEAGLLIDPGDGKEPYDRFRGRLMIPIRDQRGRVIAFGGRTLGQGEPKYLNSPDTPLFDKGRTLYNLDQASPASRQAKRLIVVEGYMDVIALDQAGIPEAVAPLGTALTETQIELLWKVSNKPLLCFDGDAAGQKAAVRAARRALPLVQPGYSFGFIPLPPGQDPDDLIKSGGIAALIRFLSKPEDLALRLWRAELEENESVSPEGRAGIKQHLADLADAIHDKFVREEYRSTFKELFWDRFGWKKSQVHQANEAIAASRKPRSTLEHTLIRSVLFGLSRYPDVLCDNWDNASKLQIDNPEMKRWFDIISEAVLLRPNLDEDLLETILESSLASPLEKRNLTRDLAFSFFYKREPVRGRSDLREVIATMVAEREMEAALSVASSRFENETQACDWAEQQRLVSAKLELRERLRRMTEAASSLEGSEEPRGHAAA